MKLIRTISVCLIFTLNLMFLVSAQSTSVTDRTPEQEALKQTEKLQKELNLTSEQAKNVYDINLKYARERKQSNKRTEALDRIRKKNDEISRVLSNKQQDELTSKRSMQSVEIDGERRYTRTDQRIMTESPGRINSNSAIRGSSDRPVRPDLRTPLSNSQNANSPYERNTRVGESRPVRPGIENNRTPQAADRPIRNEQSSSSNVRPTERNQERSTNSSSTSGRSNNSRPVRR